jgi:predicted RNA methylase
MLDGITKRGSQIKALFLVVLHKLRHVGVSGVLRRCIEKPREWFEAWRRQGRNEKSAFDREFGTDTETIVPLWKLNIESPYREQGVRYQASDPDFVRTTIDNLPIRPEEFVFIDMGSGKGRTLLVASEYPFRRIIGVEFAAELNAVAAENIRKYQSLKRKCDDVLPICADAANYEFPAENALVFLYNPFGEDVLRHMLGNLKISLARSKREVYLVYSNPKFAQMLDESDFLERIEIPIEAAVYRHSLTGS